MRRPIIITEIEMVGQKPFLTYTYRHTTNGFTGELYQLPTLIKVVPKLLPAITISAHNTHHKRRWLPVYSSLEEGPICSISHDMLGR